MNSICRVALTLASLLVSSASALGQNCSPTPVPFTDNFDSPTLDSCWNWVREDSNHWSLTERPGWLWLETQAYGDYGNDCCQRNKLVRVFDENPCRITTRLSFQPYANYHAANLLAFYDENNYVRAGRSYEDGQRAFFQIEIGGQVQTRLIGNADTLEWLRLEIQHGFAVGHISTDSVHWEYIGYAPMPWDLHDLRFGLSSTQGTTPGPSAIAAFDYLRIDPLSGTNVCGNISGVWDLAGSPYYVTCDVTVPAGQTLEIRPGVQVLFTGHYKFNVYGNLQALGTEQDSIAFTRAFPTEESKWWGMRLYDSASDSSQLRYCTIEQSRSFGPGWDGRAGGLGLYWCSPHIAHCTFRQNVAGSGGGLDMRIASPVIEHCAFLNNAANDGSSAGQGGGILIDDSAPIITNCVIADNYSDNRGGGVEIWNSSPTISQCTFSGNSAAVAGGGIWCGSGATGVIRNSIVWQGAAPVDPNVHNEASSIVLYSDVQGGYPGTGNIDADPLFVNAANGDFHLQAGSPCIDAGDPASPRDPDGTIADMGAFPFSDIPLPVELASFDALASSRGIRLPFSTASETNNDFFEIMRGTSEAGVFSRITTLPSQGNSSTAHQYEYLDREVTAGQTYWYYLADVDLNGNHTEHRELMQSATMNGAAELPSDYALAAYPNPFNPSTTISFALPEADVVKIAVFDVAGRWIQTLVNEKHAAGNHTVTFDARDLPSGVYFARMESGQFTMTRKMLLVR